MSSREVYLKTCKTDAFNCHNVLYFHRNVQQRSADNVTPNPTRQDEEPPYEDIGLQLGRTQHGPDAGHYDSLNPQTQGEQPQYDVISPPQKKKNAANYINMM